MPRHGRDDRDGGLDVAGVGTIEDLEPVGRLRLAVDLREPARGGVVGGDERAAGVEEHEPGSVPDPGRRHGEGGVGAEGAGHDAGDGVEDGDVAVVEGVATRLAEQRRHSP
jgi:hypothetical protein